MVHVCEAVKRRYFATTKKVGGHLNRLCISIRHTPEGGSTRQSVLDVDQNGRQALHHLAKALSQRGGVHVPSTQKKTPNMSNFSKYDVNGYIKANQACHEDMAPSYVMPCPLPLQR